VNAFDNAKAEETPFPPPDISSPNRSLANLSFICSISELNPTIYKYYRLIQCKDIE